MRNGIAELLSTLSSYIKEKITISYVEREIDGEINRESYEGVLIELNIPLQKIEIDIGHGFGLETPIDHSETMIEKIMSSNGDVLWNIDLSNIGGFVTEDFWKSEIDKAFEKKFEKNYAESA